jgi:O-antigen polymerase
LSKSRAGLIAAGAIGAICLLRYTYKSFASLSEKIKWLVSVFISACIIGGGISLYFYKKDSADGRLLIWKSSWDMVTDKPFFGHGANAFQPNYMLYQAAYFEKNPNSRFGNLADNVRAPFNEYLGFLIQFGVTGILLLSVLLFFYIQKKPDNNYRR